MAALMRCARLSAPAFQIPKLLRVVCSGPPHASFKNRHAASQSTLAGQADARDTLSSKFESLERNISRFRRISRKHIDPILSSLKNKEEISDSHSVRLLQMFGSALRDELPANRLKLAEEVWEKLKEQDLPLNVSHYNSMLMVYMVNKFKFSPTEFLAKMEADGIAPNRLTYQRLIARFCDDGDIQSASQVLEHMKTAQLPISDDVFHSFIVGHMRCNDIESARNILDVMRQSGLEPRNSTYTTLAVAFAERGDAEEVKKYLDEVESEAITLMPFQLLEICSAFIISGHQQHLDMMFPYLKELHMNNDIIQTCNQLICDGFSDEAYQLYLQMKTPTKVDSEPNTNGRYLLRALARHTVPVDKVAGYIKDMRKRGLSNEDLSTVALMACLEEQPGYALTVLDKMKSENVPVRTHYFWPAICLFRKMGNKEGIYEALGKMHTLPESQDDFLRSLFEYTIPALFELKESQADIIAKLKSCGFQEKDVHYGIFLFLLSKRQLQEALDFANGHEMNIFYGPFQRIMNQMNTRGDWQPLLSILAKVNNEVNSVSSQELTARLLGPILMAQQVAGWSEASEILAFVKDKDLKITESNEKKISQQLEGAPEEVLQGLKELVAKGQRRQEEDMFSSYSQMSLEELRQRLAHFPENRSVKRHLLYKACSVGAHEEAERMRAELDDTGFIMPDVCLAQLSYLHSNFTKDVDKAQHYLTLLESQYPDYSRHKHIVLKIAALQASANDVDGAVQSLQRFAAQHLKTPASGADKLEEMYRDIINSASDILSARRLMDELVALGYVASEKPLMICYMYKVLDSEDPDKILQEFENCVKTHRLAPAPDKVMRFFINREDPDSLQKVVDMMTELHGLVNAIHHLIANFVECGHIKKARKIVMTPDLRASMMRLEQHCANFIARNMINELEQFVDVTKDLAGLNRDTMLFQLMRGFVKTGGIDKAMDVLLRYEEEMIQPSARTLTFLADSLKAKGMSVPFNVPEPEPQPIEVKATAIKPSPKSAEVKGSTDQFLPLEQLLWKEEIDEAVRLLKSGDKGMLRDFLKQMNKRKFPGQGLRKVMDELVKDGELDILNAVDNRDLILSFQRRLKADRMTAALNCDRAKELVEEMEKNIPHLHQYLSVTIFSSLHDTAPELFDKVEQLARKVHAETNNVTPLSAVWCYYKYNKSPKAEEISREIADFDRQVNVSNLCFMAVKEKEISTLESVLDMKKTAQDEIGLSIVYSHMLQYHVRERSVAGVQETLQCMMDAGLEPNKLRQLSVRTARSFLLRENQPLPAWLQKLSDNTPSTSDASGSSVDPN